MTDSEGAPPAPPEPTPAPVKNPRGPKWWRSDWFTGLAVVAVFPLGLYLMWTRRPGWGRQANGIVTGGVALAALLITTQVLPTVLGIGAGPGRTAGLTARGSSPLATEAGGVSPSAVPSASSSTSPTSAPKTGSNGPTFLAGRRNAATWPFASNSIWNMPIGSAAVYVGANIAPASQRSVATDQDVIVMMPSAPMTAIQYNSAGWSGASRCSGAQTLASAPIPPSLVVPGAGANFAFAVLMPDGQTVVQGQPMARCVAGGPATTKSIAPSANLYTDGIRGAHGGSGLSSLGGTIRLGELVPGAPPIRHVLKVDLDGSANYWPIGFRWPAVKEDGYGPQRYGGAVPALKMGALLALPASLNLASLNLQTGPGRMIAWTLQNYGAYVVDDAARSVYAIATETGPTGSVATQFQSAWGFPFVTGVNDTPWARDIATIFAHLVVVDNNSPTTVGGGGTPLQPYAPAF